MYEIWVPCYVSTCKRMLTYLQRHRKLEAAESTRSGIADCESTGEEWHQTAKVPAAARRLLREVPGDGRGSPSSSRPAPLLREERRARLS